jgi:hypothetical protein
MNYGRHGGSGGRTTGRRERRAPYSPGETHVIAELPLNARDIHAHKVIWAYEGFDQTMLDYKTKLAEDADWRVPYRAVQQIEKITGVEIMPPGPVVRPRSDSMLVNGIHAPREYEALAYARSYAGSFPYMLDLQKRARDPRWIPTPKQTLAILNCKAHDEQWGAA